MRLSSEQIKSITLGASRITPEGDGLAFYRHSEGEEALYRKTDDRYHLRSLSSSGICLSFLTDSRSLTIAATLSPGSSRGYYAFDLFVNQRMIDSLCNFDAAELPAAYAGVKLSLGDAEKTFALGEGEKEVCLYFPFSVKTTLRELSLDDGARVTPIKPKMRLLCYGDSITQGYDVLHPSSKYTTRLARHLGAEEINKGIGGAIFIPELIDEAEDLSPDLITVAYGTNDWSSLSRERFTAGCDAFLSKLRARYAETEILVITPIWRKDHTEEREFGRFADAGEIIKACAKKHQRMRVIDGFDLVAHDENLFADLYLHPNDEGFGQYFEGLIRSAAL